MKKILNSILASLLALLILPIGSVQAEELTLYSDYYLLIDRDNGQVILENGSDDQIYPASMTKIMTLLVGLENIEDTSITVVLDDAIFDGLYEANASMAGFYLDERVSLEDCLYGLFLPSGAETTRAIAHYVAGSEEGFVELMNNKAKELGMTNTNFVNTTGLHDISHYTTLNDLAVLLEYALKNEQFKEIFSTRQYTATSGSMHQYPMTWQSNMFAGIERIGWQDLDESTIIGGKTGYTIPAGLCLASVASYEGRDYMLITSYAPTTGGSYHVIDAVNVYSEIYYQYSKHDLLTTEDVLSEIDLRFKLFDESVSAYPEEEVSLTLPNYIDVAAIEVSTEVVDSIDAPIVKNQVLGTATLSYENEVLYTFNVVANEDIERSDIVYYSYVTWMWMMDNLIWTGVIVFIIGFILWRLYVLRYDLRRSNKRTKRRRRVH